jgi:outer membrane protein assembly factor BamB
MTTHSTKLLPLLFLTCFLTQQACSETKFAPKIPKDALEKILSAETPKAAPNDWPWWRGPNHDGAAVGAQLLPEKIDVSKHIQWQARIQGRGHGTPIVAGDKIFLLTSDEQKKSQSAIALDRKTGKQVWVTEVHKGKLDKKNKKATHANGSLATDGQRVYLNFVHNGAAYTTALKIEDGKTLWQTKLCKYKIHQGYGSTPLLYKGLLIVTADNKLGGLIAALNPTDGAFIWTHKRPKEPNYPSPVIHHLFGKDQLIMTGCDLVTSLDPSTGKVNWEIKGATTECVTTTPTDGKHIYTSGGYPKNHVSAVVAEGSGKIAWENNIRVYVPSMIHKDGYIYAVTDGGIATCWKSDTGQTMWKGRLGGVFSASPTLLGNKLYAINEYGELSVFSANPNEFQLLHQTKLADEAFASPVICGNRLYQRVVIQNDRAKEEYLYCIGQ